MYVLTILNNVFLYLEKSNALQIYTRYVYYNQYRSGVENNNN